jgi:hypothetical protein
MDTAPISRGSHAGPELAATFATLPTPVLDAVAARLGIGVDTLRAQLAAGKPLGTIARVAGLAHEELAATVADAQQPPRVPPPARDSASVELLL